MTPEEARTIQDLKFMAGDELIALGLVLQNKLAQETARRIKTEQEKDAKEKKWLAADAENRELRERLREEIREKGVPLQEIFLNMIHILKNKIPSL